MPGPDDGDEVAIDGGLFDRWLGLLRGSQQERSEVDGKEPVVFKQKLTSTAIYTSPNRCVCNTLILSKFGEPIVGSVAFCDM